MLPVLAPAQLGREALECAAAGVVLGSVRSIFPVKGRGAFLPDVLLAGAVLFGMQSYAASLSSAGVLRWYMIAACLAGAAAADRIFGTPVRAVGCVAAQRARHAAARWQNRTRRERAKRCKQRRNAERTAKNPKKSLPNTRRMLYNSNGSKQENGRSGAAQDGGMEQ